MSRNRHMSSLRKVGKSKQHRRKSSQTRVEYQALEDRKLLAADVFMDIPTGTFGRGGPATPNQHGAVGPEHIVEVTNGRFQVFDRTTGAQLIDKSINDFWLDPGAVDNPGAGASEEVVGNVQNSKVIYDADTRRWFIASEGTADVITGAPGVQSAMLLAVSRSSNPVQDWAGVSDVYDEDADPESPLVTYTGGIGVFGLTGSGVRLGLDGENVYVGGAGGGYLTINKFENLVVPNPTTGIPFFGVIRIPLHGELGLNDTLTRVSTDVFGTSGDAVALTADGAGGNTLVLETIDPAGPTITGTFDVDVDDYASPLPRVRQLFDPDIELSNGSSLLNAQRVGDELWAVHGVNSSFDTAGIRWYRIDLNTQTLMESGTIEHPERNYYHPTIAVTSDNNFVIGYTSSGLDQFPTMTVSLGYENNGQIIVEAPMDLKDGESGYFDGRGNLWGRHNATVVDPDDPTKVFAFGQWSDVSDNGITQLVGLDLVGHSAILSGDENDNEIIIRKSAADPTQIEVVIDGTVVQSYEEEILYSIQVDGGGGDDTFVIDTSNGEMDFPMGVEFIGDSDDQVEMRTDQHTTYDIAIDGSGVAQVGNDFAAVCDPVEEDVRTFVLNFEAGSAWFDATPFDLPGYEEFGYTTFGDAYRGELQRYFDETIAPLFAGSFTITLDINDDEVDSLASATALGFGFEDVDGQMLRVASPWSIITGRGDRNGVDNADGVIDYNLELDLYGGDRQLLLDNIAGGLTRTQFFKVLGMDADTPNHTQDFDPRGDRTTAQVIDTRYVDLNGNPIITDYNAGDNTFLIDAYQINGNWAGDNSGIFFVGIDEMGNDILLPVNSNSELIDFDTIASTLAGTSRDGDFNTINLQDRAFLRGLGYELNPIVPIVLEDGLRVSFEGIDQLQSGDGNDAFCIRSSNVDFEVRGGIGNDNFIVTGLGVGAIDLYGEAGDDTYSVVFSPAGVITIVDSEGSENDTLNGLGTSAADTFVFEENGVRVNGGLLVYTGIENISFNGQGNDDVFDIRAATNGITGLSGGAGNDTFIVNDLGAGANGNTLTVSVNDPLVDPLDQLRLEIESVISDTYLADQIENLQVDGTFIINGVNGTPTVAGGLNLLGDGNERLIVDSSVDASWLVDGNGSGTVTMDVDPMTFTGLEEITSGHGVDDFNVIATDTDLLVHLRDGDDSFRANSAGMGMLTVDGNLGNDTFEILNSGGGIVFRGNEGEDDFTVNDGGLSAVNLSGDGDNDTFMILRAGVAGVMLTGDDGDDHVTIDNSAGTGPIMAQGGTGNDQFDVVQSGPGDLTLMGEVGDDLYNVYQVEPATIFTILDSVNSENDQLGVFGTDNDDTLELELDGLTYNGGEKWDIQGIESYSIDGMLGNDSITVTMGASFTGEVTVLGNDGDDILTVVNSGSGMVTMDGGEGDDQHIVHFMSFTNVTVTDSGTGTNDNFTGFGTGFDDTISLATDTANINGGTVMMVGIETVLVDGLGGDDTFNVDTNVAQTTVMGSFGNDLFNILGVADGNLFHGNQGNDTFNVTATGAAMYRGDEGNDEFTVAGTDGGGEFYGGIDMDTFHVMDNTGELSFFGEAGVDHFNIENHTPLGSAGVMRVDGGDDRNTMTVTGFQSHGNFATITSSTITGMSGIPIEYAASGSFSLGQPIGGITLIGSANFNDGFTAASLKRLDSLLMLGGGGNDRFTVSEGTLGRVSADGEEGSDLYQYAVGSMNNRNLLALDTGVTGSDRIVISMTEGADNLTLAGEAFTVQTDNFKFNQNFESMIINARGGDDLIDINHVAVGFMRVIGGTGNDNFVVNNFSGVNSMLLQTGSGDDSITANAGTVDGFLNAYGGTGNDTFTISQSTYSNSQINGEEGSDTYNISVADRSSRYVVARDTGTVGTDTMNVYGTVLNDRFDLRVGLISVQQQRVFYNQNTETTNIMTGGAPDIASVYGFSSPEVNLMTGADDDLVFVHSTFGPIVNKVLNVSLGFGNDSALVKTTNAGSTVNISGDGGNDLLNMGSSLADNNGNLGAIQGEVHFDGGVGNDRVNLNDAGRGATAFYDLGPGFVRDGGSPSATFAGLTFAGTENVRLDGTPYRNHVDVSASTETTFRIFGNGGYNSVTLVDGDDAELFGQSGGSGGWTFDNDLKDVYFEDFFVI